LPGFSGRLSAGPEIRPKSATQIANVGVAQRDLDRFDDAAETFSRACGLDPENSQNHFRWGVALLKGMRPREALVPLQHALLHDSDNIEAGLSLALSQFAFGDYHVGGETYEVRFHHKDSIADPFPERRWTGEKIEGTLVVGSEQGMGEMLQFARFATLARQRCSKLVIQAHAGAEAIMRSVPGVDADHTQHGAAPLRGVHPGHVAALRPWHHAR